MVGDPMVEMMGGKIQIKKDQQVQIITKKQVSGGQLNQNTGMLPILSQKSLTVPHMISLKFSDLRKEHLNIKDTTRYKGNIIWTLSVAP